jgi:hypothetical protein
MACAWALDLTAVPVGLAGGRAEVFIITVTLLYLFLGLSSLASQSCRPDSRGLPTQIGDLGVWT